MQSTLPAVPSLALGSAEVTLLEMTRAFGAVAAGVQTDRAVFSSLDCRQFSASALYKTWGWQRSHRPIGRHPGHDDRTAAGGCARGHRKSGAHSKRSLSAEKPVPLKNTAMRGSSDLRGDIVVGVWVGNDDNSPTNRVTGGDLPANIWRDFVIARCPSIPRTRNSSQNEIRTFCSRGVH